MFPSQPKLMNGLIRDSSSNNSKEISAKSTTINIIGVYRNLK